MPAPSATHLAARLAIALAAASALPVTQAQAQAQEPAQTPSPDAADAQVVVTATRSSKALAQIPGAVSVITRRDIEAQGLVSEDPGALLSLQVPGYAPSTQKLSNFGEGLRGRTALLLLDGIPQTNPLRFGGREGYFADAMVVSRIEVVSGASAMQGMGATGGILNTITRRAEQVGTHHTVALKYGSQGHADSHSWKLGYLLEHRGEGADAVDVLAYLGARSQDVGVDGQGRRLAVESLHEAADAFVKIGRDFGEQRLQLMVNRFESRGFDNWVNVPGSRATGVPTSSQAAPMAWDVPRNRVQSASLDWTHASLGGGAASVQLFWQDFAARYTGGVISTFQDTRLAPSGTLVDQSEVLAEKQGLRSSWVRPNLLLQGLELTLGLDLLRDTSSQRLTQTGRMWVPPLNFSSTAPFTQLEYTQGPLTLRGGLRDERSRLQVDDYSTLAFYGSRAVAGGTRRAHELVKSLGGVWRFGQSGWSSFVSYNEGFGPPDAGLILRAVRTAGQSVNKLVDLQPVVTENRELGLAWRGNTAQVTASVYESSSDLGSQIVVTNSIGTVQRVPIVVKGFELAAQWQPTTALRLDATYARTRGRTAAGADLPLTLDLGARSQSPDKLVLGAGWQFAPGWHAQASAARWFPRDANVGRYSGTTLLDEHFAGYTVADLSLRWQSPWGDLGLGVENLFNRQFITYYSQSHYAGADDDYYAGRGRALNLSWQRRF
ncbi:TonB-dependent receptor [Aquabacterium sp. OR-4]|uniref:TonB-dependent receptor n=1 Tax=Aquabacterium sp. OR-4 TaxID=2978127 RepID=UPI0028C58C7D|nr:TonB-dependent receptor plug domain-containing protein [Aquabacterium sp. OR-4]MDT7837720.1 TonB-dependent receptor [Aquabacterium sp. OR-4]